MDASDAASLYAEQSSWDHSVEGSFLDSLDLTASTEVESAPACFSPGHAGGAQQPQASMRCSSCRCHEAGALLADGAAAAAAGAAPSRSIALGVHSTQPGAAACCCHCHSSQHSQQHQQHSQQVVALAPSTATHQASQAPLVAFEPLTARFGPVIRTLGTGDSFGELALLQCSATRTATVVVAPPCEGSDAVTTTTNTPTGLAATAPHTTAAAGGGAAAAVDSGALLIKISRACYDQTVRALQVCAG